MFHLKHFGGDIFARTSSVTGDSPRDESTIRQEQNDLAFRRRQARGLRTMNGIVSDAVPGFDFLAFFGTVAVVLGAFYGGYICWTLGLDVAQATKATAYGTWAMFNIAGDFIANRAPTSQVLFGVGWIVRWIFGIYFAACAGVGAVFGAGAAWVVTHVMGALHHAVG